jgi:hypothetical protein
MTNTKKHEAKEENRVFFVIFVELRVFVVAFETGEQ